MGRLPDLLQLQSCSKAVRRPYFKPDRHRPIIQRLPAACDRMGAAATSLSICGRYEPVPSVEAWKTAFCAVLLKNPISRAVSSTKALPFGSRHNAAVLRPMMTASASNDESDASALRLGHIIKSGDPRA